MTDLTPVVALLERLLPADGVAAMSYLVCIAALGVAFAALRVVALALALLPAKKR